MPKSEMLEFSPNLHLKKRVFWYLDHSVAPAELGEQFGPKSSKIAKMASQTTFTPLREGKGGFKNHAQLSDT